MATSPESSTGSATGSQASASSTIHPGSVQLGTGLPMVPVFSREEKRRFYTMKVEEARKAMEGRRREVFAPFPSSYLGHPNLDLERPGFTPKADAYLEIDLLKIEKAEDWNFWVDIDRKENGTPHVYKTGMKEKEVMFINIVRHPHSLPLEMRKGKPMMFRYVIKGTRSIGAIVPRRKGKIDPNTKKESTTEFVWSCKVTAVLGRVHDSCKNAEEWRSYVDEKDIGTGFEHPAYQNLKFLEDWLELKGKELEKWTHRKRMSAGAIVKQGGRNEKAKDPTRLNAPSLVGLNVPFHYPKKKDESSTTLVPEYKEDKCQFAVNGVIADKTLLPYFRHPEFYKTEFDLYVSVAGISPAATGQCWLAQDVDKIDLVRYFEHLAITPSDTSSSTSTSGSSPQSVTSGQQSTVNSHINSHAGTKRPHSET